tara:strand:+ start:14194 stop:14523 length:330 start_codon:yes stop_codon:yes gene_type:complete
LVETAAGAWRRTARRIAGAAAVTFMEAPMACGVIAGVMEVRKQLGPGESDWDWEFGARVGEASLESLEIRARRNRRLYEQWATRLLSTQINRSRIAARTCMVVCVEARE